MNARRSALAALRGCCTVDPAIQKGYQSLDELAQADPEGIRPIDIQRQAKDPSDEANGKTETPPVASPEGGARPGDGERPGGGESSGVKRAMVAAKMADLPSGERTDLASIEARSVSQPKAAAMLNVARASGESVTRWNNLARSFRVGSIQEP